MIYFLSDLHLGAKYFDNPREKELAVVSFLDSIAADAEEVYLLGDILDYWYEYKNVVPRGYVRFFAAIARLTDAGIPVYWMTGNHDVWLFDYLTTEIGITVYKGALQKKLKACSFCSAMAMMWVINHPCIALCVGASTIACANGCMPTFTHASPTGWRTAGRRAIAPTASPPP